MVASGEPTATAAAPAKRIPRSCSDVFRLWAAVGLGVLIAIAFELLLEVLRELGLRQPPTGERQSALELDFGAQLISWNAFVVAYLLLGFRAFAGCNRAELVRRIKGSPLPKSIVKRYLLAGGSGPTWAVVITVVAFSTIITAIQERQSSTELVFGLVMVTVSTSWIIITFSFALHYARRDIEAGGLEFSGNDQPVFSDYIYLAVGCSATFGTTDTNIVTTAMRRTVSVHSVLGFFLNTVVIAVLISLVV
jgi:uncharacterized membrane protein